MRVGELFAGYGGLGMAVKDVWPEAEVAWVSEFDKGPSKVLAHRFPDVPNLGDITKIDWTNVPPVDVITGGSPCQDLSHAGARRGMTEGTRSNLWVSMREAIATVRPRLVVWENVRGAFSAQADSAVEPCAGCVGDGRTDVLRALGRVLGDLSELGYDAAWCGLRAADVGAAHGRFRVFVLAWDATAYPGGFRGHEAIEHDGHRQAESDWGGVPDERDRDALRAGPNGEVTLLPTVTVSDSHGVGVHGRGGLDLRTAISLLPTPAVNDMGEGKTVEKWDSWTDAMKTKHGNGNGHGKSLAIEAQRLLPTPTTADANASGGSNASNVTLTDATVRTQMGTTPNARLLPTPMVGSTNPAAHGQISGDYRAKMAEALGQWGDYAAAIQRWEHVTGRPAPEPTQLSAKGNPQLSARFTEWLMGVPDGWITDVPGVTRNEALKMCGNGVVPQQGAAALRWMLAQIEEHA